MIAHTTAKVMPSVRSLDLTSSSSRAKLSWKCSELITPSSGHASGRPSRIHVGAYGFWNQSRPGAPSPRDFSSVSGHRVQTKSRPEDARAAAARTPPADVVLHGTHPL